MPEVQQPVVGPPQTIEERFGWHKCRKWIARLLRRGRPEATIARAFGWPVYRIRGIRKRDKIKRTLSYPEHTFIYSLRHPLTYELRWIGKSDAPFERLRGHCKNPCNKGMSIWIKELLSMELEPKVGIVAKVKYKYWRKAESALIKKFAKNNNLLNVNS